LHLFDLTLPTPVENLAADEALLDHCEAHGAAALRFWEAPAPCVVLGFSNSAAREAKLAACARDGVPVLRRCSGGGTVLLGSGCLNYALVLPLAAQAALATVSGANQFILQRNVAAWAALLGEPLVRRGDTDLVWRDRKCSGNAQRRRHTHLLFHGTLLLGSDLAAMAKYLALPSRAPEYRRARDHEVFLTNLPLSVAAAKQALAQAWQADGASLAWPTEGIARLVRERYARAEWNARR
jgi:lipoate-protein ligase A